MDEVNDFLNRLIKQNKTPSLQYIIFNKDSIIHRFQAGLADIKNQRKVTEQTTFCAFSVTKTFTALAILQLAEKNKLNIDETVIKYLPDFPYPAEITIRQLLAHTAGIPNPNPLSWIHRMEEHDTFDRNDFFKNQVFKKHEHIKSLPNAKFAYSNLGYIFLGQVIEKISKQSYEDYVWKNIIEPLGVSTKELGFEVFDESLQAKGYQKRWSGINLVLGFFIDKSKFMDKAEGMWKPFKKLYINGTSYGGLIGTPNAFVKYIQALLKPACELISDDFKSLLFTENFSNDKKATGMCLSWFKGKLNGETYYCHAGGGGGYYCEIRIYPNLGLGSVIMFNRSGMRDERFLDRVDKYFL